MGLVLATLAVAHFTSYYLSTQFLSSYNFALVSLSSYYLMILTHCPLTIFPHLLYTLITLNSTIPITHL
ncbi:hypothetical protein K435DRAFT_785840, partial [Dendrothele bispora CBS 962.96]